MFLLEWEVHFMIDEPGQRRVDSREQHWQNEEHCPACRKWTMAWSYEGCGSLWSHVSPHLGSEFDIIWERQQRKERSRSVSWENLEWLKMRRAAAALRISCRVERGVLYFFKEGSFVRWLLQTTTWRSCLIRHVFLKAKIQNRLCKAVRYESYWPLSFTSISQGTFILVSCISCILFSMSNDWKMFKTTILLN